MVHVTHMNGQVCGAWSWCLQDSWVSCMRLSKMVLTAATWIGDSYVWHNTFLCAMWLIRMCDVTRSYVRMRHRRWCCRQHNGSVTHTCGITLSHEWHKSAMCATSLVHTCVCVIEDVVNGSEMDWRLIFAAWLFRMFDVTYSYVRRDSFTCATWLVYVCICVYWRWYWQQQHGLVTHMCQMTLLYVWHNHFTNKSHKYSTNICEMTLLYVWHNPHVWHDIFTCAIWRTRMCDMTRSYGFHVSCSSTWCPTYEWVMILFIGANTAALCMYTHMWRYTATRCKTLQDFHTWDIMYSYMRHETHMYQSCRTYDAVSTIARLGEVFVSTIAIAARLCKTSKSFRVSSHMYTLMWRYTTRVL